MENINSPQRRGDLAELSQRKKDSQSLCGNSAKSLRLCGEKRFGSFFPGQFLISADGLFAARLYEQSTARYFQ